VKRALPLVIALALLAPQCAAAPAPAGAAPRAVVLQVDIVRSGVELNRSFGEQTVLLNGTVNVDYVFLVTVRVALSASTDLGWPASVEPAEMSFVASVAQFFNATVKVPAGTVNRTAVLTVRGNATIPPAVPLDTSSDTATIAVLGEPGGGGGNGTPSVPRGPPARTGVFVPPVPLIMAAVTAAAIGLTAYFLWYWRAGPSRRPEKRKKTQR
jgi:hypothetical protein